MMQAIEDLYPGTHFTCFTGTKVQILTPEYKADQKPMLPQPSDVC